MTETPSIKVSKELKARLRAAARSRQAKPSALVREALELVIAGTAPKSKPSLYDLSKDLFANLGHSGPQDLSTSRKHLDDLGQ
jgi:hypothetical protein